MPSRDPRIDQYIADAAPFARAILRHLRQAVHEGCPDVVEVTKWGAPGFEYGGRILAGMAAFKAHATFGFWHQGMMKVIAKRYLAPETAMGQFGRITRVEDLPSQKTLAGYVRAAAKLNESGAAARPKPKPRPELPTPSDLAAALKKNQRAAKTFTAFSPSHRREFIEWIVEAKREETRRKRIATTLEWLAAGKSRNWKYANC